MNQNDSKTFQDVFIKEPIYYYDNEAAIPMISTPVVLPQTQTLYP
jgi:hypothetical protein